MTSSFTSNQVIRRFWTPELLFPDSTRQVPMYLNIQGLVGIPLTMEFYWVPPLPSQPSSLLRNAVWPPPFDLCVCCETPLAPFGMSSTTNERSQRCVSNLPAPEPNDLRDPKQALRQNWTPRLLSPAPWPATCTKPRLETKNEIL